MMSFVPQPYETADPYSTFGKVEVMTKCIGEVGFGRKCSDRRVGPLPA